MSPRTLTGFCNAMRYAVKIVELLPTTLAVCRHYEGARTSTARVLLSPALPVFLPVMRPARSAVQRARVQCLYQLASASPHQLASASPYQLASAALLRQFYLLTEVLLFEVL